MSAATERRVQKAPPRPAPSRPAPLTPAAAPAFAPAQAPPLSTRSETPPLEPTGRVSTAVVKVMVTSRAVEFGTFRRWLVARKRPAGVLPELALRADAGRQDAPSRPAFARSLPPRFQTDAGSGAHPGGRLVPRCSVLACVWNSSSASRFHLSLSPQFDALYQSKMLRALTGQIALPIKAPMVQAWQPETDPGCRQRWKAENLQSYPVTSTHSKWHPHLSTHSMHTTDNHKRLKFFIIDYANVCLCVGIYT